MFENRSYENILQEMLDMAPPDVDTRQGSIYYNHCSPVAFMLGRYYMEMGITVDLVSIDTCVGEFLDHKAAEHNVKRNPSLPCVRQGIFDGGKLAENMRFFADDCYFKLKHNESGELVLVSETPGEEPNGIPTGTVLVPVSTIPELKSARLGNIITPGTDAESDENLRRRIYEKIAGPAENGNAQHYKSWCESVEGVGLARIEGLWNGANTVRAIIVGTDGLGASEEIVQKVQQYVDPGSTGLGEGVANIGAKFTALSAKPTNIDISFNVQITEQSVLSEIKEKVKYALTEYLKNVSLESRGNENMVIRTSAVSNVIYGIAGIVDYSDLTVNGSTANVIISFTNTPKLGGLNIEQEQV